MADENDRVEEIALDCLLVASVRDTIFKLDNQLTGWNKAIVVIPINVCCGDNEIPLLFVLFEDEESGALVMSPSTEPQSSGRCSTATLLALPDFAWIAASTERWAKRFHAIYVAVPILTETIQTKSIRHQ